LEGWHLEVDIAVESARPILEEDLEQGLHSLGFKSFRPGQRESIETLLDSDRLLLVAPTGGGKSLIYQLPAALLPGTTIVVSPLISLMHDQVAALEERGVTATYFARTLDDNEMQRRLTAAANGEYKLIYVAPERLALTGFRNLVRRIDCRLVAIDEAHCISEWGHDFRPEYLHIGSVISQLAGARVLACTATATPVVRDEILERLGLPADTPQRIQGFARPNLALRAVETQSRRERRRYLDVVLRESLGHPSAVNGAAIVYAPTRKSTEEEANRLGEEGWRSASYHAGMDGGMREQVQDAFTGRELDVIVATNAFGMGIDRPDVRCIVHLAPPGSIEAYYQEVGRAGRDGEPATCLMLTSPGDMALRRRLIESDTDGLAPPLETVRHKWNLFLELMRWAEGGVCRHDAILRYFGDEAETLQGCGNCDVCAAPPLSDVDAQETSVIVRKALCGVARVHGRFGIQLAAKLLAGTEDERLSASGLRSTQTFGALKEHREDWLNSLLRRCVTAGWVEFEGGDRPLVVVTEAGKAVIYEKRAATLRLPPSASTSPTAVGHFSQDARTTRIRAARAGGSDSDEASGALFEALRAYRLEKAREQGVPPYVVASDRTLRDIALLQPTTIEELTMAHGIGKSKADKFGCDFLRVVREGSEK
jgi:ATP-dependent DNA helicase RecQ